MSKAVYCLALLLCLVCIQGQQCMGNTSMFTLVKDGYKRMLILPNNQLAAYVELRPVQILNATDLTLM